MTAVIRDGTGPELRHHSDGLELIRDGSVHLPIGQGARSYTVKIAIAM